MGYLNEVNKIGNKYIRKPKAKFSNWKNELEVMNLLGFHIDLQADGTLEREWIEGETIKELTQEMRRSLISAIEKIHALPKTSITGHDWFAYAHHIDKLSSNEQKLFLDLAHKYQNKDLVVSHNDLNFHNMLWNGKAIIPIDFEWANLNHPYFDYVQFFIAEGINLLEQYDQTVWNELQQLSLLYFTMWTYEAPQEADVLNWRKQYQQLIDKLICKK